MYWALYYLLHKACVAVFSIAIPHQVSPNNLVNVGLSECYCSRVLKKKKKYLEHMGLLS